jgi:hypothetical protein
VECPAFELTKLVNHQLLLLHGIGVSHFFGLLSPVHVGSRKGNDSTSSRSCDAAWRSLAAVNRILFNFGDRILLAAGSRYTGHLAPRGSGTKTVPVVADVYGGNEKARIDGRGEVEAALLLRNVQYWRVSNLELTNDDPARGSRRYGYLSRLTISGPCTTLISRICSSMMSRVH